MSGRGKKINQVKNHRAWQEWMEGKKISRRKQVWVWHQEYDVWVRGEVTTCGGHWEKA